MGASASSEVPPLERFDDSEQRTLLRNFALLANRGTDAPGTFDEADFTLVHAAMPQRLAAAIFRGLTGGAPSGATLDCDAVIGALASLRVDAAGKKEEGAMTPLLFLHDAFEGVSQPSRLMEAIATARDDGLAWLEAAKESGSTIKMPSARETHAMPSIPAPPQSRAAFAAWAVSVPAVAEAASVLSATALAAWLVDLRKLEPLPGLDSPSTMVNASSPSEPMPSTSSHKRARAGTPPTAASRPRCSRLLAAKCSARHARRHPLPRRRPSPCAPARLAAALLDCARRQLVHAASRAHDGPRGVRAADTRWEWRCVRRIRRAASEALAQVAGRFGLLSVQREPARAVPCLGREVSHVRIP